MIISRRGFLGGLIAAVAAPLIPVSVMPELPEEQFIELALRGRWKLSFDPYAHSFIVTKLFHLEDVGGITGIDRDKEEYLERRWGHLFTPDQEVDLVLRAEDLGIRGSVLPTLADWRGRRTGITDISASRKIAKELGYVGSQHIALDNRRGSGGDPLRQGPHIQDDERSRQERETARQHQPSGRYRWLVGDERVS